MDLVATIRKEGSRGGRGDFKWSDVQTSTHREHYLGHSLMAPVGRWQKGKDLNWYAKETGDAAESDAAEKAARERREEIRKVKEAEQDALARALGFEVAPRNPNMEALGDKREVDKILKEAADEDEGETAKGVGYGTFGGASARSARDVEDRLEGNAEEQDAELKNALREYRRRHGAGALRRRSRSRSRDNRRVEKRSSHHRDSNRHHRNYRSRSRERHRRRSPRSRSRSWSRSQERRVEKRDLSDRHRQRDRSRSPRRRAEKQYHERQSDQRSRRSGYSDRDYEKR